MVENRPAKIVACPGNYWLVRVVDVTSRKHLVAVARGVEEVNRLTTGNTMACGPKIE
jgi:hypothetical protein